MNIQACLSSGRMDWETPLSIFLPLNKEFSFEVDAAATALNAKLPNYFGPDHPDLALRNSLKIPVWPRAWLNPPYGREIVRFMEHARKQPLCVCLVPSRTDTAWWHNWVIPYAAEIRYLRGRVRFVGAPYSAPFPSAIVVYKKDPS